MTSNPREQSAVISSMFRYLCAPRSWRSPMWPLVVWCRLNGHPAGPIWHNPGGTEPDMHCKFCGDDLG
jgi:hypothetical protein